MGYAQRAARAWAGLATAVAGLSVVAVFGLATPAAADVSFDSQQGQRTGGARVALRVTNEHPTASIVKVELRFPDDVRLPEVYPIAVADWAPSMTMKRVDDNPENDVTGSVVWVTMPGREVKPGAASVLPVAMGPMPDREAVYLDVIQTRSDGSIETWAGVDVPVAGARHPALKLELTPLAPGQVPENHHGGAAAASDVPQAGVAADPVADDADTSEGSGTVRLAVVLLIIAGLTAFALYWQRRRGATRTDGDRAGDRAGNKAAEAFSRVPAQRKKGAPSKKTPAPAVRAAGPVASAATVQRRSVVRTTVVKKGAAGRRTVARKTTGGAATATIARRSGASNRAGKTEGDNA